MDSKLFRLATGPNFNGPVQNARPVDIRTVARSQTVPAPDSRFPGWPAPMADGRMVTNYQPHCENNIPAGKQYPTVRWMQRNGESIIDANRTMSALQMGAEHGLDPTVVPPPSDVVRCTRSACERSSTGTPGGIGLERRETVPELFGTYMVPLVPLVPSDRVWNSKLTGRYEGGRNSLRGRV
jgi:hypothetical protein